jgi:purine-binding chemotaxis protein CheW
MRPLPVGRISATIPFVTGVAIIRGAAVPVVDLGKVLGSDDSENPTRFITLRIDERTVALSVEEIVGIRTLATASMQRLPPLLTDVDGQLISSLGTLDAALLLVLRAARLLPDAEWTALLDDGGLS